MWIRAFISVFCASLIVTYHVLPKIIEDVAKIMRIDLFTSSLFMVAIVALFWNQVVSLGRSARRTEKRFVVVILCTIFVVAGMLSPTMKIDSNAIWLIGIAAIVFVLPNLRSLMPYVKKIKIGDAELELREDISVLEREVERATDAVAEQSGTTALKGSDNKAASDVEKVIEEAAKSPRAALLLLSAKIEEKLRRVLRDADIDYQPVSSSTRLVELGVKHQIFPLEILSAIRDFASVRNRVAHGAAFDIDDSYILSIISLGTQLLNVISAIEVSSHRTQGSDYGVEE